MDGREKNERNFNYDWGDYACTHNLWRITRSSIVTLLWVVNRGGGRLCLCPSNWKINSNLMGSHSRIVQWNENALGFLLLAGQQRCQSINRQFVRLFPRVTVINRQSDSGRLVAYQLKAKTVYFLAWLRHKSVRLQEVFLFSAFMGLSLLIEPLFVISSNQFRCLLTILYLWQLTFRGIFFICLSCFASSLFIMLSVGMGCVQTGCRGVYK